MLRRTFLNILPAVPALVSGCTTTSGQQAASEEGGETFEVTKTEAEWQKSLTAAQFRILREEGTEPAFSSSLNDEHRRGTFQCAGCDLPVYSSETKFQSGTGWPSFTAPLPDAIRMKPDRSLFTVRTEVHCRRCGGHLGHLFDDGPPPTRKRYCMNGAAMTFTLLGS